MAKHIHYKSVCKVCHEIIRQCHHKQKKLTKYETCAKCEVTNDATQ